MGLFDRFFKSQLKERTLKTEEIDVVGECYYLDNIYKLTQPNEEYRSKAATIIKNGNAGKRIYQYTFINKPVKLVPEPSNLHDKNAVKVIIAGELVGYIPRDTCLHVKDILKNHEIKYISAFISGGKYKIVPEKGDVLRDEKDISIHIKIAYLG